MTRAQTAGSAPGGHADAVADLAGVIAQARDLLAAASRVVVLAHVHPDADALGSALALGMALSRRGVQVQVSFSSPAEVPQSLRNLPGQELVVPASLVDPDPDLLVTTDVNTADRLGELAKLIDRAPATLVIDHHASNTYFGTHHLVDPRAESTTVLIGELLRELGTPLDAELAANLYAGLATDTVGFRHASAAAHRVAAELLDTGIEPDEVLRPIIDTHPVGWLRLLSTVLGRARLQPVGHGRQLIWTGIGLADAAGLRPEELDSVIDILRTTAEAQVAAVFKEMEPQQWQVSLRSGPGVDVSAVAVELGGGGHVRAAGYGFQGRVEDAVAQLVAALA